MRSADEARLDELDRLCDGRTIPASVSDEIFQLVDVLDTSPGLRRAFTDPAYDATARTALAEKLFGTKFSQPVLWVLEQAVAANWRNGQLLADALERQAVRGVLKAAMDDGSLDTVIGQLNDFDEIVSNHHGLREALQDGSFPVPDRSALVSSLVAGKVTAYTETLLRRCVNTRERNYVMTLQAYVQLAARLRSREIAHVVVARPLNADQRSRLCSILTKEAGRPIDLKIEINPEVIGGLRVQLGEDRIDSTVSGRLEDAQRQLVS